MTSKRAVGGFTLVEVALATAVLLVLLSLILMTLTSWTDDVEVQIAAATLEGQARRVVDRIADELKDAGSSTFIPAATDLAVPNGSASLSYQKCTGFSGGVPIYGPQHRIEFEYPDPSVPAGGGLVRRVEGPPGPGQQSHSWTHDVASYLEGELANGLDDNADGVIDERGLSFVLDGTILRISLTLERMTRRGFLIRRTVRTSVRLRNG